MKDGLSHLAPDGTACMVDVGLKATTRRVAIAAGFIQMQESTLDAVLQGTLSKGEVLQVARIAGIQAAKRTGELIPLCHPLGLDFVQVLFERKSSTVLSLFAGARLSARTGIEMEALTAVSVAGLTVYDMAKAVDKTMVLGGIRMAFKTGGKSNFCELTGTVLGSSGTPPPDGRISLSPASGVASLSIQGIPFPLLPEGLILVGESGFRADILPGGELLWEPPSHGQTLPKAGSKVVVRLGDSYAVSP